MISSATGSASKEHICNGQDLACWIPSQWEFMLVATKKEGKSLFWTTSTTETSLL